MHRDRTISAAVPAYSEARQQKGSRTVSVCREVNGGAGAAITTGDRHSPEDGIGIGIGIAAVIPAYTGDPATGGSGKSREGCF